MGGIKTAESDYWRKCWYCEEGFLIWGGDHDCEPEDDHLIVSNLSCGNCNAFYLVYWGEQDGD